ncbi:hypothetical protein [Halogeometricum sp. CBA1124]|uniref:hypothetical protein n=1 Tax=Halogeometricum sp. CBA1124 TaxID=2668071 RepID=UPI00142A7975|nr:hypothetical protein [Halogeometricum sp. CBA1124]MUV56469.1 hypothetical protein [Halogeometricum sp. CBA1124]
MADDADSDATGESATEHTTDAWEAQSVVDDRSGYPAHASKSEGQGDEGLLRVGFRDDDEDLKRISWDEFREEFEEKELALAYSTDDSPVEGERTATLVERDHADA